MPSHTSIYLFQVWISHLSFFSCFSKCSLDKSPCYSLQFPPSWTINSRQLWQRIWNEIVINSINVVVYEKMYSYISRIAVDDVNSLLVAKVLPQAIRSKYEILIVWAEFVHQYWWFCTEDWYVKWLRQLKFRRQRRSVELRLFQICIANGSWNLQG